MNIEIEPTDYRLEIKLKKCAMDVFVNDLKVTSYYGNGPMNTLIGIGEYLKPEKNKIRFVVKSSNNQEGYFDKGALCQFTLKARERNLDTNLSDFFSLKYSPTNNMQYNKSLSSLNIISGSNEWGKLLPSEGIIYHNDKHLYEYTQQFDIKENYSTWMWVNSTQFSKDKKVVNFLPEQYQNLLQSAYQEYWSLLISKDISGLKEAHQEMLNESVKANGGDIQSYFSSLGFESIFNDNMLKLQPTDFSESKVKISLDGRVVYMSPSPIRYLDIGEDTILLISPKFRFDGNKFIVTR
ncbi:hypothetical protein Xmau_01513 [Xenorhabdus mauleonii]|uniref:Uncharacterized protein n=1 Tax=Xenorhabdus mauleonii TaxID=351675 RepID=A0A1I3PHB2_9GAMM|nr:hypothetical protein [Xenorhabdus mauleonii]PHM44799.1 hypothetical protein Xmau_01513 [Xenorhabdus mauleonii]SFJ20918.1 hypothetical protein SAMN05421680_106148 [Xenorhabdus mauleonii]